MAGNGIHDDMIVFLQITDSLEPVLPARLLIGDEGKPGSTRLFLDGDLARLRIRREHRAGKFNLRRGLTPSG